MNQPTAAPKRFIEIVFAKSITPGDLTIIQPATLDQPGQARLGKAREEKCRVFSHNGGALIGVISEQEFMMAPFDAAYWLLEENGGG